MRFNLRPEPGASVSSIPAASLGTAAPLPRAGNRCNWANTRDAAFLRGNTSVPGAFIELRVTSPKTLSVMYLKDTEHRYYIHRKYFSQ